MMNAEQVRITILVDNSAGPGLISEHGFAVYIENQDNHILFDTGQGEALFPNACFLRKDLSKIGMLVLSHGHYDHSGAVDQVLHQALLSKVYLHSAAVQPRYSIYNGTARSIQMPRQSMAALDKVSEENLQWVSEPVYVSDNIGITGPIPRLTEYEDAGGPFFLDTAGHRKDVVEDDQALWVRTRHGLVVVVGCAHAGLVNTLNYIRQLSKEKTVRAVLGGFHLQNSGSFRLEQTIAALSSKDVGRVIPCHCTGEYAVAKLRITLGDKVTSGSAGMTYLF